MPRLITGLAALVTLAALAVLPGSAATARGSATRPGRSVTFTHRTVASPAAFAAAAGGAVTPIPSVAGQSMIQLQSPSPLSTARCLATIKLRCYSPLQYRVAYDLAPLYQKNITGQGQTIMIVDSFGSPTINQDLASFDQQWGLPNPPPLNVANLGSSEVRPVQRHHGRLGRRDHPRRRVRPRHRARGHHRSGRDAGGRDRGRDRLPAR